MKIKFLLSDLDGVIRTYPSERAGLIEKKYGLKAGSIFSSAYEKTLLTKAVCGYISDEQWRLEITRSLASTYTEKVAAQAVNEWSDFSGIVDKHYFRYLELKYASVPVAVLTNGTSRLQSDLIKLGIENRFYKIFNSADIGACKPDKKIYQYVVDKLGCNPNDILFIDDSLSHVQAAEELGIQTHHYRSLEEFERFSFEWLQQ